MTFVQTVHTADLDAETRQYARSGLEDVFVGELTDHDREHALRGVHVPVREGTEPIAHASLVQRRLVHGGRALRTG